MPKTGRRGIEKDVTIVMDTAVVRCVFVFGPEFRDKKPDGMQDSRHFRCVASDVDMDMQKDP